MIFIDASRYNNTGKRTGVENYSYFLINALIKEHGDEITLITPKKLDLEAKQLIIPFPRLWTHLRLSWEVLKTKKIDTLFVPSHVLPLIHPKKSVITIHDVAFKESPQSYDWKWRRYLDWSTRFAVKKAHKIIVPSQKTKSDLIKFYHCPENKIEVIPLGFSAPELKITSADEKEMLQKHGLQKKRYFLYVGRIEHKKNSDKLIEAFKQFSPSHRDLKLVMAGFPGHGGEAILNKITKDLKPKIVLPGYISEKEKQLFLKNALCFIFPSREEGFGIPLLEAMAAQLPIIASDIPTSKEIAAKNAFFFSPENTKGLAELMEQIDTEKDHAKLKTNHHRETLQKYSWEKCADAVYQVLKS